MIKKMRSAPYKIKNIAFRIGCAIFFMLELNSCAEDSPPKLSSKDMNFPTQIIHNANIVDRDSGFVKMRAKAPLIEKYDLIDTPYIVARKGVEILFYDKKKPKIPGTLKAKYAKMTDKLQLYEAKGNVHVVTNEGQTFMMQSVFWDKKIRKVYTNDTVFVTDKDGTTIIGANGMEAKDDFSKYEFRNASGSFPAKQIPNGGK